VNKLQGLPSESFVSRFKVKLREFPGGKELFERLEQSSCGAMFVLISLELHCGAGVESPRRTSIKDYRSRRESLAEEVDKLSRRLTKIAPKIERINSKVAQQLAPYGEQPFMLPDQIRSYVSLMATASKELRDVSLRTTPMDALNVIADCMKGSDGKVDYDDVALLLGIGYAAYGVKKVLSPEDARRRVKRARARRVKQTEQKPIKVAYRPGFARP